MESDDPKARNRDARRERLDEALRANLRRRKAQVKGRLAAPQADEAGEGDGGSRDRRPPQER